MKIDAFGLLEVRGLVTAIGTADAMLKAAQVRLIRQHQVNPGFISLIVEGDLAACRAAVDAGAAAAARLGEIVSRLEIGRPDGDTETMVLSFVDVSTDSATSSVEPSPTPPPPLSSENESVDEEDDGSIPDARTVMLTFISRFSKGCGWSEIMKFFPEYAGQEHLLEKMVEEGILRKKGRRYLPIKNR